MALLWQLTPGNKGCKRCWANGGWSSEAERLKIALWAILTKEPICRGERSMVRLLPSSCKFFEFYEYRGTRLIGSR